MFSQPLPMEYPSKVNDLIEVVKDVGVEFGRLYQLLRLFALKVEAGAPAHIVLGAPMRRKAAGEELKQHLTVWELTADALGALRDLAQIRSEEHTSELQSLMRISYAVFCLNKNNHTVRPRKYLRRK